MNWQELLRKRQSRSEVPQKMAASALNLCMGCPLAAICPTKTPGECPPALAEKAVEYSAYGGDYAPPIKTSYLKELLDDSKPTVMAKLARKPAPAPPRPTRKLRPAVAPMPQSVPTKPAKPPKQRLIHPPAYPHEQLGEAIADIFYGLFSVQSMQAAKKVRTR